MQIEKFKSLRSSSFSKNFLFFFRTLSANQYLSTTPQIHDIDLKRCTQLIKSKKQSVLMIMNKEKGAKRSRRDSWRRFKR